MAHPLDDRLRFQFDYTISVPHFIRIALVQYLALILRLALAHIFSIIIPDSICLVQLDCLAPDVLSHVGIPQSLLQAPAVQRVTCGHHAARLATLLQPHH